MAEDSSPDITALTVQLLSAFVSNNTVPSEGLSDLIKSTRAALTDDVSTGAGAPQLQAQTEHAPAVSIRKSLASDDHVISLIDGKPYKTLKRHLSSHGLTPEQYRERYKLPKTYPLVARSYSQARRAVAERLGLGRKPVAKTAAAAPAPEDTKVKEPSGKSAPKTAPKKAGRAKAAPVPAPSSAKSTAPAQPSAAGKSGSTKAPRKRLSIAAPKDAAVPADTPRAAAAKSQPKAKAAVKTPAAPRKAKAAPKPKAAKGNTRAADTAKGSKQTPEAKPAE